MRETEARFTTGSKQPANLFLFSPTRLFTSARFRGGGDSIRDAHIVLSIVRVEKLSYRDVGQLLHQMVSFGNVHKHREYKAVFAGRYANALGDEHGTVLLHAGHVDPSTRQDLVYVFHD